MIGTLVTHYRILSKLGSGGMGVVYKAEDLQLKRTVALKFLPVESARDTNADSRFLQEARAASALDHPNICAIHEISKTEDGRPFIVMSYYEGEGLDGKIAAGALSISEAVRIISQVAEGLATAHRQGIIHRDIKPANILLTTDHTAKIVDFGIAKLAGGDHLTKTGSTLGTAAYMSPELVRGETATPQSDLWSLGVTFFEMLAGRRPFRGEHEAAVMYEILNTDPPSLQQLRPDVPQEIEAIVSRLLQKETSARFASASELIDDLRSADTPAPHTTHDHGIAVMYFENMSAEQDTEHLCAGMTEDIITDLSKVTGLKVTPRSDVLPFRNKAVNIRKLAELLRVRYVLEGTVRRSQHRIRVTAQLTDVHTGFPVWADRFDSQLEDLFDLQDEISGKIVRALRISLTDSEKAALAKRPTDDVRAYDFYLRGKELILRRGKRNAELAIQMLERAIAIDTSFVMALAGLAEAFSHLYTWYDREPRWLAKIIELSEQVLTLEPDSLEARLALATVYLHQNRLLEAKRLFASLVESQSDYYDAWLWLGVVQDLLGEHDAAIETYTRAIALKPYSEEAWTRIRMAYDRKGDQQSADNAWRKIVECGSERLAINPDDAVTRSRVAASYAYLGDAERARVELRTIMDSPSKDGHALYNAACAYAVLKDKSDMLQCLKVALDGGQLFRTWVKKDPDFNAFRNDTDFQKLVEHYQ